MFRLKLLKSWLVVLPILAVIGCGVPESSIEVKTAREAAAANCEQSGKCVKDPSGLVLYNSDLVTENFILKTPSQSQTLLTRLINLVDEPKLLIMSGKLDPLIRGVRLVSEAELCDSPKGIDGLNPSASQLRAMKQGRYKACITYIGDGLFKRVHVLPPIDVDTTAPMTAQDPLAKTAVTATSASLYWTKSSDNLTAESRLVYSVYTSKTQPLDSINSVQKYGSIVPGTLVGGTSYIINSLSPDTDYHAAVVVADEAGNQSLVGQVVFKTPPLDATAPSVSISSDRDPGPTNLTAILLTIQFSEPVSGFSAAGVTVNGATKGQFTAVDADTYTLSLAATASSISAIVPAGSAKDAAANNSLVSNPWTLGINGSTAAPVASPSAGVYTSTRTVELSSQTPGATIYYTLDGSNPTNESITYSAGIPVNATTTIKAFAVAPNHNPSDVVSLKFTITGKVAAPTFSVPSGAYGPAQTVELTSATPGATIYFTDDDSVPSRASTLYTGPITVSTSKTIKAFAVLTDWDDSVPSSAEYTINGFVDPPTASPQAGTYTSAIEVALSSATPGANIVYSVDSSVPTIPYSTPILVQVGQTIRAAALKSNFIDSSLAEFKYVITGKVQAPTFSLASGSYGPAQTVELTSATPGATIYFTDDDSVPSRASTLYTGPITVSTSKTIKAFAVLTDWDDSVPSSAEYTINGFVDPPTASPQAGTYTSAIEVALSSATPGAIILYTVDGPTPSSFSLVYSQPIFVQVGQTIKAIAVKPSYIDSAPSEFVYTINGTVQKPELSPPPGVYATDQIVSMTSATPNASIFYTTDGSEPSRNSTRYIDPITVSSTQTINAFAVFADWADSAVETAQYTINGPVANPIGDPAAGTYNTVQTVRLLTVPADAQIYFTTDGSDPVTSPSRILYTDALTLSSSTVIKAMASRVDFADSETVTFEYNILPAVTFSQSSYTLTANLSNASIIPTKTDVAIDNCTVEPGLPSGLALNINDCSITGTPMSGGPSTSYRITPMNAGRSGDAAVITIVINGTDSMGAYYFNGQLANGLVDDGTVLLLHMDGDHGSRNFIDNSTVRKTATVYGDARIDTGQSRFGNASAYFDGSEDRIFFPSESDFNFGQGDFTVEFWFNPTSWSWSWGGESAMVSTADPQDEYGVFAGAYYGGQPQFLAGDGSWRFRMVSSGVGNYQWHHMAITRSDGVAGIFVNGTLVQTAPDTSNLINPNNGITIGGRTVANQYFQGYIDEVRVTKGYSRYKDSFTPPNVAFNDSACYTAGYARACTRTDYNCPDTGYCSALAMYFVNGVEHPGLSSSGTGVSTVDNRYYVNGLIANGLIGENDPHSDKTVLLMHMDGANGSTSFADASSSNRSIARYGNTQISTVQSKFGNASAFFDGGYGSDLQIGGGPDFNFGSENFTIEAWVQLSTMNGPSGHHLIACGSDYGSLCFGFLYGNQLGIARRNVGWDVTGYVSVTAGTWYHVALSRENGTIRVFLDGNLVAQGALGQSYNFGSNVHIGSHNGDLYFPGYIDDLRITKNIARYTSNFTPPAVAMGGACYSDGYARACSRADFGCPSTGYCAALSMYFINGDQHPGLNSSGTGTSAVDNKYYVNGALADGVAPDHNIVLLLHMDGYHGSREFTDSSSSAKSASVFGETYIHSNSKFGSGSAYFDGSGDYLSFTSPSDFRLGTGDFTAELWFNSESAMWGWCSWWGCGTYDRPLLTTADPADTDGFLMMTSNYYSNTLSYLAGSNWNWWPINRTYSNVNSGTWNHYAVSRQSGTTRVFLNGSLVDSFGDWVDYTNVSQAIRVGGRSIGGQGFHGYIDEVRVTKGKARYTTSFSADNLAYNDNACYSGGAERACGLVDYGCPATGYCSTLAMYYVDGVGHPGLSSSGTGVSTVDNKYYVDGVPANGLVSDLSTSLLLHMDGVNGSAAFIDSSALGAVVTPNGSAVIDGVRKKVGTGSVYFNGSSDLSVSHSSGQLNFGSGDFTIHGWINPESLAGDDFLISGSDSGDFFFGIHWGQLGIGRRSVAWDSEVPASIPTGVWTHVAVTRQAGVVSFYVNGELIGQRSNNTSYGINSPSLHVGSHGGVFYWRGNIDELQVTKGLSRYVSNFVPPMRAIGSTCYGGGYARACTLNDYGCSATGYCSMLSVYVIDGVEHPGLNSNGTGISTVDNKYYVNGAMANGRVDDQDFHRDKTILLMHLDGSDGSTNFSDSSALNQSINRHGSAAVSTAQSKFGGGSVLLTNGGHLTIDGDFNLEGDSYTAELWVKPRSQSWNDRFMVFENSGESRGLIMVWNQLHWNYFGSWSPLVSSMLPNDEWSHVAIVNNGGAYNLYVNGLAVATTTSPLIPSGANRISIGASTINYVTSQIDAYIDEVRITKGVARYASDFTPPTASFGEACYTNGDQRACNYTDYGCAADGYCPSLSGYLIGGVKHTGLDSGGTGVSTVDNTYYMGGVAYPGLDDSGTGYNSSNGLYYVNGQPANGYVQDKTVLLMHMDGSNGSANFVDSSAYSHSVNTLGSAQMWSSRSKFGDSSVYFDGGSCLETAQSPQFKFGSDDFTVEMWAYVSGGTPTLMRIDFGDSTGHGLLLGHGPEFSVGASSSDGSWNILGNNGSNLSGLSYNTWQHVALTRQGNQWKGFVDGVERFSISNGDPLYQTSATPIVRIGAANSSCQYPMIGHIDEVRVTRGLARYTGNFTPPKLPFARVPTGVYNNGIFQAGSSLGSSPALAAQSAEAIKAANPFASDGLYWIDLPGSGPTLTYCLMDEVYDGGGWMLMMKATQGTTFNFNASYWTQDDTLNPYDVNTNDGDAKFEVMNKFAAKDIMAIWPDIQNGGSIPASTRGWTWLQKNFYGGMPITPIAFFAIDNYTMNYGGSGLFISDAKDFSGWASGVFSSQTDIRFYGFNYSKNPGYWSKGTRVRWGFGWNENGEGLFPGDGNPWEGSNDVSGGIGMDSGFGNYSAGDMAPCCQDNTGINRSARVEIYVK